MVMWLVRKWVQFQWVWLEVCLFHFRYIAGYQSQLLAHSVMMIGPSGCGKSLAWKVLLKDLEKLEGIKGIAHVIDLKGISKEDLYRVLDPNMREWTNGLFTHILKSKRRGSMRGKWEGERLALLEGTETGEWREGEREGGRGKGFSVTKVTADLVLVFGCYYWSCSCLFIIINYLSFSLINSEINVLNWEIGHLENSSLHPQLKEPVSSTPLCP